MTTFTAQQRAELRDAAARSRVAAVEEIRRLQARRVYQQQPSAKRFLKKAKQRRRVPVAVEPRRELAPVPPSNTRMEVKLTRNDLSVAERYVFDRLYGAVNTGFSTIDVVTHCALVARTVVAARRGE